MLWRAHFVYNEIEVSIAQLFTDYTLPYLHVLFNNAHQISGGVDLMTSEISPYTPNKIDGGDWNVRSFSLASLSGLVCRGYMENISIIFWNIICIIMQITFSFYFWCLGCMFSKDFKNMKDYQRIKIIIVTSKVNVTLIILLSEQGTLFLIVSIKI